MEGSQWLNVKEKNDYIITDGGLLAGLLVLFNAIGDTLTTIKLVLVLSFLKLGAGRYSIHFLILLSLR